MTPYYERSGVTIYNADCLEVMPQLEPPFDAIIADPPYGTTACDWDDIIPLEPMWENYKRLIKANGAVVLFGSQPFTSMLVMSNLEWFKYDWVWDKVKASGFLNSKKMPLNRAESILVFGDKKITYNPQMTKRDKVRTDKSRDRIYGENGESTYGKRDAIGGVYTHFYPDNILVFQNANQVNKRHPTQKPVALMAYLIRTYTNESDIVLDNAMGSGTTLVAAQNEGRRCVGIEISEEYCQIAVERLRQPSFWSIPEEPRPAAGEQMDLFQAEK